MSRSTQDTGAAHLPRMRPGSLRRGDQEEPPSPETESLELYPRPDRSRRILWRSGAARPLLRRGISGTGRRPDGPTRGPHPEAAVLAWLEATLAAVLQPGRTRDTWFEPALGQRLGAARLMTLADMLALIGSYGRRWKIARRNSQRTGQASLPEQGHTCPRTARALGDSIADR